MLLVDGLKSVRKRLTTSLNEAADVLGGKHFKESVIAQAKGANAGLLDDTIMKWYVRIKQLNNTIGHEIKIPIETKAQSENTARGG